MNVFILKKCSGLFWQTFPGGIGLMLVAAGVVSAALHLVVHTGLCDRYSRCFYEHSKMEMVNLSSRRPTYSSPRAHAGALSRPLGCPK